MLWIQWLSLPAPEAPPHGAFFVSRSTGGTDQARAQYILQANVAGTNLVQLTHEAGDNFSPTWSPDSQRLAFATNRDGFYQIYVMQVDGSEVQRLTDTNAREEKPAWSPHQFETSRPLLCPVTQPSGSRPPGEKVSSEQYYGNGALWTVLPTDGILYVRCEGSGRPGISCHGGAVSRVHSPLKAASSTQLVNSRRIFQRVMAQVAVKPAASIFPARGVGSCWAAQVQPN